jgi:hypothetical protein
MHEAGHAAYARRDPAKSGIYSFEQRPKAFPPALEQRFRTRARAWAHFQAQPPGYQRLAIWYVMSAKREDTQLTRLARVMEASATGGRLGVLFGQTGKKSERPKQAAHLRSKSFGGLASRRSQAAGPKPQAPGHKPQPTSPQAPSRRPQAATRPQGASRKP